MRALNKLVGEVYRTYPREGKFHWWRVIALLLASLFIALYGVNLGESALPAMALTMSILAGFTFTALFSGHSLSVSDLPAPLDESDRHDISRLRALSNNFRLRSKFFIILSIFDLFLIVLLSIEIDGSDIFPRLTHAEKFQSLIGIVASVHHLFSIVVKFVGFAVFIECLYTFYRLAETVLEIVDVRRAYVAAAMDKA